MAITDEIIRFHRYFENKRNSQKMSINVSVSVDPSRIVLYNEWRTFQFSTFCPENLIFFRYKHEYPSYKNNQQNIRGMYLKLSDETEKFIPLAYPEALPIPIFCMLSPCNFTFYFYHLFIRLLFSHHHFAIFCWALTQLQRASYVFFPFSRQVAWLH